MTALGFSRIDCKEALQQAANQLDEAALWLTQHARPERLDVALCKDYLDIYYRFEEI